MLQPGNNCDTNAEDTPNILSKTSLNYQLVDDCRILD